MPRSAGPYPLRALALVAVLASFGGAVATGNAPCMFAWISGLPCPSCGSGRSVRALLSGDFSTAWQVNPLGIPAALVLALVASNALWEVWRRGTPWSLDTGRRSRLLRGAALTIAVAEALLWLLRFMGMLGGPVPV